MLITKKKRKEEKKAPRWKKKYESPIRNGWTLTHSEDGDCWEWRRTRTEDMEARCRHSGGKVMQADISLMEGRDLVPCMGTGREWHPIEMATDAESNAFLAEEIGLKVKEVKDGETTILINRTWHPTWFVKYHKGEFMSWTKYYDDILTGKKSDKATSFKKKEKQRHSRTSPTTVSSHTRTSIKTGRSILRWMMMRKFRGDKPTKTYWRKRYERRRENASEM